MFGVLGKVRFFASLRVTVLCQNDSIVSQNDNQGHRSLRFDRYTRAWSSFC